MPTVPQSENTLKSYFETGDKPTGDQFFELVGTMFHNDIVTQGIANAAEIDAAAAIAVAAQVLLKATRSAETPYTYAVNGQKGVASVTVPTAYQVRITFATPFANANYVAILSKTDSNSPIVVHVINQTTTFIQYGFSSQTGAQVPAYNYPPQIFLVVFAT